MIVYSVIVSYNPQLANLIKLVDTLVLSRSNVVIIDNSEGDGSLLQNLNTETVKVITLGLNKGIACAQNMGINEAVKYFADVIVFFDQDSVIESDFLKFLLAPLKIGEPKIVAPVFFDQEKGYEFPSMIFNRWGLLKKIYKEDKVLPFDVDVIISSGSAATVETFKVGGMMDERYFIDFVDTEWCIRCKKKGIPIMVVPNAIMKHTIGDSSINFGIIRGFIHTPIRCYYKIRNSFLFSKDRNAPVLMRIKELISTFVHHSLLIFFVKNKKEYLKNYGIAVIHGITGVIGKKPK